MDEINSPGRRAELLPQFGAWEDFEPDGYGSRLMTSNTLTGAKVINRKDETLGTIADIVLNVEQGAIAYAVMASGGFMGMGERYFALPWYSLALDRERKCCVLNADKSSFEVSPALDERRLPEVP